MSPYLAKNILFLKLQRLVKIGKQKMREAQKKSLFPVETQWFPSIVPVWIGACTGKLCSNVFSKAVFPASQACLTRLYECVCVLMVVLGLHSPHLFLLLCLSRKPVGCSWLDESFKVARKRWGLGYINDWQLKDITGKQRLLYHFLSGTETLSFKYTLNLTGILFEYHVDLLLMFGN